MDVILPTGDSLCEQWLFYAFCYLQDKKIEEAIKMIENEVREIEREREEEKKRGKKRGKERERKKETKFIIIINENDRPSNVIEQPIWLLKL